MNEVHRHRRKSQTATEGAGMEDTFVRTLTAVAISLAGEDKEGA